MLEVEGRGSASRCRHGLRVGSVLRVHQRRNVTTMVRRWYTELLVGSPVVQKSSRSDSVSSSGCARPVRRNGRLSTLR